MPIDSHSSGPHASGRQATDPDAPGAATSGGNGAAGPGGGFGQGGGAGATADKLSLLALARMCLSNSRTLVADVMDVATLETKLATLSVMEMLVFALGAALLMFTIWTLLLAAVAAALITAGLSWWLVLLSLAVLSGIGLWLSIRRIRTLSGNLRFAATRHLLRPSTLSQPYTPSTEAEHADPNAQTSH